MSLKDQIMSDVKQAMKDKQKDKLATLRFLQAAIKNKEIDLRPAEITEDDVLTVLKKSVKQRKDSISQFEEAGRQDLVDKEKAELQFIEVYLPSMMSEEQIQVAVDKVLKESGSTDIKQMGQIMKAVIAETKGLADNSVVSQLVRKALQ